MLLIEVLEMKPEFLTEFEELEYDFETWCVEQEDYDELKWEVKG